MQQLEQGTVFRVSHLPKMFARDQGELPRLEYWVFQYTYYWNGEERVVFKTFGNPRSRRFNRERFLLGLAKLPSGRTIELRRPVWDSMQHRVQSLQ